MLSYININVHLLRTREACFQFAMKLFPRAHSFTSVGIDHFDRDATTRALWPSSAQNLECLSLMAPSLRYTLPLELTETATPRLHTLRLTACQADWKMIGPLPLLKVLDLYYITDRLTGGHAPPMPDLLNALRQMPLLETFAYHTHSSLTHLKHMLVRNEEGIRDFQGPEEPEEGGSTHELVGLQDVSLPQLRDLYISSTLARTVAIVKHIPQPRDTLRIEIPCFLREAPAELLGLIGQFGQHLDKQGHSLTTACMSTVPLHPHIVTFAFWDSPQAVHLDARLRVTGELRTVGTHRQSLGPLLGTTLPLKEVETLFVDSLDVVYADEFKMFQLHMPRCTTICINSKQINNSLPAISKDQFCVQGQRLFLKSLERFVLYNFSPDYLQKTSRKPHLLTWNSVVLGLRSLPRELSVVVAGSSSEGKSKLKPLRSAFENFEYVDLPHREDDIAQREGGLRGRIAQHSGVVDMSKFLDMLNILP